MNHAPVLRVTSPARVRSLGALRQPRDDRRAAEIRVFRQQNRPKSNRPPYTIPSRPIATRMPIRPTARKWPQNEAKNLARSQSSNNNVVSPGNSYLSIFPKAVRPHKSQTQFAKGGHSVANFKDFASMLSPPPPWPQNWTIVPVLPGQFFPHYCVSTPYPGKPDHILSPASVPPEFRAHCCADMRSPGNPGHILSPAAFPPTNLTPLLPPDLSLARQMSCHPEPQRRRGTSRRVNDCSLL